MKMRNLLFTLLILFSLALGFPLGGSRVALANDIKLFHYEYTSPIHNSRLDIINIHMKKPNLASARDHGVLVPLGTDAQIFTLLVTPPDQEVCAPADAVYTVDVGQVGGSSEPVTLSADGNPTGTTVGFSSNPVIPPSTSFMTIGNTGAATEGSYIINVTGTTPTFSQSTAINLQLFSTNPSQMVLLTPQNGSNNVPIHPTFTWAATNKATSYHFQLVRDPLFIDVVIDVAGFVGTTYTPPVLLDYNKLYYWQGAAQNACGEGEPSDAFQFTTQLSKLYLPLLIR